MKSIVSFYTLLLSIVAFEPFSDYEDTCYNTQVVVHEDFTATVNQYKEPYNDKDLVLRDSKCWDLSKREVSTCFAAIISPWLESYLSKMKKGIDTLLGLNIRSPSAAEALRLLKRAHINGESVFTEYKRQKDPVCFVEDLKMYLSCYCDVDEIGKKFEELQVGMGIEPVGRKRKGSKGKGKERQSNEHSEDFTSVRWNKVNYLFNKTQALCIGLLWQEYEKGTKTPREKSIGEKIDSAADNFRLCHTFRNTHRNPKGKKSKAKMHPAWGKMIIRCGKGLYGLAD